MSDKLKKPESMTFEEASEELDGIVKRIDAGEADLEAMIKEHARGQLLVKRCRFLLEEAEQQLKTMEVQELE
ncbi:MAG: exodeoxyribonuclease VII small subunit [Phycisphaerae bacterium]|nr:exodeoxyribonuclease VII small subunit [Phycisphaerae bacterium]|tara:strand:- start:2946 stop:3161 length:216 start_codon:yes stop_codon:yes gene_type:complete